MIKIQLCEAKMRVGCKTSTVSKMKIFVAIVKIWKMSNIVTKISILNVTVVLYPVWAI